MLLNGLVGSLPKPVNRTNCRCRIEQGDPAQEEDQALVALEDVGSRSGPAVAVEVVPDARWASPVVLTLGKNFRRAATDRCASWPRVMSPVPGEYGSVGVLPLSEVVLPRYVE